jgi:outer membrane protein TolC
MKKLLFIIPFLLNAQILSPLQQKLLDKDLNKAVVSGDKLKNSWINPIILQYKYNRSNQIESNIQTTNQFGVSINQPIFKSGAIWASVKYAKYLKNENLEKINLQKRTLIKQAYDILLNIHKINISIQKQKLLIKNANIDIQRKKEQYLSGILDSSFLDNAILNKNNLEVALEDLVFKKKELIDNFKTLSDLDYKSVALPHLELISKNKYLTNLNLKIAKQNIKVKKALKGMNLGNSLVSVNFLANYTNIDTKYSKQTLLYQNDISNFYNIGFSVTIPLDVNTPKTIQESKIDYLKSVLEYRDKVSQSISQYDTQIANIKAIDKKIDIYKNSIATYNSLIEATKNNIKAGTSTDLDLETLQNSKQINQLNIESLQIDKQSVLLELYYLVGPLK